MKWQHSFSSIKICASQNNNAIIVSAREVLKIKFLSEWPKWLSGVLFIKGQLQLEESIDYEEVILEICYLTMQVFMDAGFFQ